MKMPYILALTPTEDDSDYPKSLSAELAPLVKELSRMDGARLIGRVQVLNPETSLYEWKTFG